MDTLFSEVIREHLELRERNARLERAMPLERYFSGDPTANNALFKSESEARLDDTDELDVAAVASPRGHESASSVADDASWGRPRAFDWSD
jgi:hypothetical protein